MIRLVGFLWHTHIATGIDFSFDPSTLYYRIWLREFVGKAKNKMAEMCKKIGDHGILNLNICEYAWPYL